jgi:hypothetical protein
MTHRIFSGRTSDHAQKVRVAQLAPMDSGHVKTEVVEGFRALYHTDSISSWQTLTTLFNCATARGPPAGYFASTAGL